MLKPYNGAVVQHIQAITSIFFKANDIVCLFFCSLVFTLPFKSILKPPAANQISQNSACPG